MALGRVLGSISCTLMLGCASLTAAAEEMPYHFAVGAGINYTGYGFSFGHQQDHRLIAISAGLMSTDNLAGNLYGGGLSYQRNDLWTHYFKNPENHAFGIYLGTVGNRFESFGPGGWEYSPLYGGALTYNYFFNGFSSSGFHVGAFIGYGEHKNASATPAGLQIGFRF